MTLNLDTSRPIRSLARQRELVMAIYSAPPSTQETDWVEWKSKVDVGERRWQAELARQVLGMANRDPEVAAKWSGGCGFVVIGVSPGALVGTVVHDAAKIEGWLTPYVGRPPNAPDWAPTYVEVDGHPVLILTVEPPQVGHRAWPCRKTYSPDPRTGHDTKMALRDGAIYVRHKASTEEAGSADIEMLSRRSAGAGRRIGGISLLLTPHCRAISIDPFDRDAIAAWAERERAAMKPPPLRTPEPRSVDETTGSSLRGTAELIAKLSEQMTVPPSRQLFGVDARTLEAYEAECDAYIAKATKVMPLFLIRRLFERKLGRIALSVRNNTDDPIGKLQVELVIKTMGVTAASEAGDLDVSDVALPKRPPMLGKATHPMFDPLRSIRLPEYDRFMSPGLRAISRGVEIDNSNSTRLTFRAIDLYPEETVELEEFYLLTTVEHTGATLTAEWSARSRDLSGVQRETIDIEVAPDVPTLEMLLADEGTPTRDDQVDAHDVT